MAVVCLCNRVNDRQVRRAIVDGASTVDEIGLACRAGTTCGGCRDTLDEMLGETLEVPRRRARLSVA